MKHLVPILFFEIFYEIFQTYTNIENDITKPHTHLPPRFKYVTFLLYLLQISLTDKYIYYRYRYSTSFSSLLFPDLTIIVTFPFCNFAIIIHKQYIKLFLHLKSIWLSSSRSIMVNTYEVLTVFQALSWGIVHELTVEGGCYYYHPHFINKDTELQRG